MRLGAAVAALAGLVTLVTADTGRNRATWVWDAAPLLRSPAAQEEFLTFAAEQRIGRAWIQVSTNPSRALGDADQWRAFLTRAHASGLAIDALDGAPDYVLPRRRGELLATVRAIVTFNEGSDRASRFDGIHLDNEPYLLAGWHDPITRDDLVRAWRDTVVAVRQIGSANGLAFGIDIPFWLPDPSRFIDLVDHVGIMDYRNTANGNDGLVAHAEPLLSLADSTNAKVYVGVETTRASDVAYWLLSGVDKGNYRRALERSNGADRRDLAVIEDGSRLIVGIAARPDDEQAEARLSALAQQLGARVLDEDGRRIWNTARSALANQGEWRDLTRAPIIGRDGRAYGGWRATRVMLPKLTFAGKTNDDMSRELQIAERAFSTHRSYAGIAIHDYASYRARFDDRSR